MAEASRLRKARSGAGSGSFRLVRTVSMSLRKSESEATRSARTASVPLSMRRDARNDTPSGLPTSVYSWRKEEKRCCTSPST
eukprot:6173159-Pleurochrysis_carterae.AAC.2